MSGRPRGRPRKVISDVPPSETANVPVKVEVEEVAEKADNTRRSSPRKRKPANFDGFLVETPGRGIKEEDADVIKEIEEEDPIDEDDTAQQVDDTYKPGATTPATKRRGRGRKRKQSSIESDGDLVRMDDIEDDMAIDDPMRRVERRGRKKKSKPSKAAEPTGDAAEGNANVEEDATQAEDSEEGPPKLDNQLGASATAHVVVKGEDEEEGVNESGKEQEGTVKKAAQVRSIPVSPRKSPRSPSKASASTSTMRDTPSSKTNVISRRKQLMGEEEEEFEETEEIEEDDEGPEELIEEDLVDVETFEVQPAPVKLPILARLQNKPFRCAECGASYRREAYLLNHLAIVHQDECAILSSAERTAKRAERRPERMIPRERPGEAAFKFGCDLCERRFLRWEGLVVHQKQIHKEVTARAKEQEKNRDYGAKCPVCNLYFFGNHALSEHVNKVHPDHNRFIFACDICGMGFMHWARVRAHKTQIHNVPVKYTQGYLKRNPEMAKVVEAQRMRKAVERNRAKRMLEKGILTPVASGREFSGLSRSEINEYMYLMPPHLEPEIEGEMYDDGEEEIVEEEGIIDANEMMNIEMVPLPPSVVRRPPLPPRLMGYREYRGGRYAQSYPHRSSHQLAALHQRVTHLDRQDLEILNRRLPPGVGNVKEEEDLEVDVEAREELVEEEVVDDGIVMGGEMIEEQEEEEEEEEEEVREEDEDEVDVNGEDDPLPVLDMYE